MAAGRLLVPSLSLFFSLSSPFARAQNSHSRREIFKSRTGQAYLGHRQREWCAVALAGALTGEPPEADVGFCK